MASVNFLNVTHHKVVDFDLIFLCICKKSKVSSYAYMLYLNKITSKDSHIIHVIDNFFSVLFRCVITL